MWPHIRQFRKVCSFLLGLLEPNPADVYHQRVSTADERRIPYRLHYIMRDAGVGLSCIRYSLSLLALKIIVYILLIMVALRYREFMYVIPGV